MRIPGGDAVQRVWSVADAGGYTLVSIDNDSPSPIAVAFTRRDLATDRPVADIADRRHQPADRCGGAAGRPSGDRHRRPSPTAASGPTSLPPGLPGADGRRPRLGRPGPTSASRLDLPEAALVEAVRAARCEVLLVGPPTSAAEPERHLLGDRRARAARRPRRPPGHRDRPEHRRRCRRHGPSWPPVWHPPPSTRPRVALAVAGERRALVRPGPSS